MAKRRRVQRRSPRAHQTAEPCISYFEGNENSASVFTPKEKEPHTRIVQNKRGKFIVATKERALR